MKQNFQQLIDKNDGCFKQKDGKINSFEEEIFEEEIFEEEMVRLFSYIPFAFLSGIEPTLSDRAQIPLSPPFQIEPNP